MHKTNVPFSNWNTMIQGLEYSPQEFFTQLEEEIRGKQLSDIKISRVNMSEGGMFSADREYLRVVRKRLCYDICGAPFGNGFFVSAWLGEIPSGIMAYLLGIPYLGRVVQFFANIFDPETYYTHDTRAMYQALIHDAVTTTVDKIAEDKGLRMLTEDERKPSMKDFFSGE